LIEIAARGRIGVYIALQHEIIPKGAVMDLSKIPVGDNPPWRVNVVVEVPMGADPVKYELDKESGAMYVDRFLHTAMFYPCNYGFVPHTLSDDGDPVDVLIANRIPVLPGAVVKVRPIGVLVMDDEKGQDEKILAVPVDELHPYFSDVASYRDLPKILLEQVAHFFQHYKDLETNKWVKIKRWGEADEACRMIEQGIASAKAEENKKAS
jgi:inorganic pyrophosphatase